MRLELWLKKKISIRKLSLALSVIIRFSTQTACYESLQKIIPCLWSFSDNSDLSIKWLRLRSLWKSRHVSDSFYYTSISISKDLIFPHRKKVINKNLPTSFETQNITIQECCEGFMNSPKFNKCIPMCSKVCTNSYCIGNNKCKCKDGFHHINDHQCMPKCEPECGHDMRWVRMSLHFFGIFSSSNYDKSLQMRETKFVFVQISI